MKLVSCSTNSVEMIENVGDANTATNTANFIESLSSMDNGKSSPYSAEDCVATIGNFDGIHIGHQAIIELLKKDAKDMQLPVMLISFEPLPKEFFLKETAEKRILNFKQKFQVLQDLNIDIFCLLRFNKEMASLSAKDFIHKILGPLRVRKLIIGEDFRFGKDRQGDIEFLKTEGDLIGLEVNVAPMVYLEGEKVSSSNIRKWLEEGNIVEAEKALGRKI